MVVASITSRNQGARGEESHWGNAVRLPVVRQREIHRARLVSDLLDGILGRDQGHHASNDAPGFLTRAGGDAGSGQCRTVL